jgi:Zn-dependent peptidase ImmA (M78 family)
MKAQDEIKSILFSNEKSKVWLAQKLGISKQDVHYMLNTATDIPHERYAQIIKIFKAEGFICSADEKCDFIKNQTLETNDMIGKLLSLLNNTVRKVSEDNVLDFREKKELSEMVDYVQESVTQKLDEIRKIIEK